jgi:NAD(P)-dependent dehydrogenase (short-subunit alcohol dehydrogenase family)
MSATETRGPGPLADRVAIVTGASRGIGRGIAIALGAPGGAVSLSGRTTARGALAADPATIDKSGRQWATFDLGRDFGLDDPLTDEMMLRH